MSEATPTTLSELVAAAISGTLNTISDGSFSLILNVDKDALSDSAWCSSTLNIQAFLTSMECVSDLSLVWSSILWDQFNEGPNSYPLLATCMLHTRVKHIVGGRAEQPSVGSVRSVISKYRLLFDTASATTRHWGPH